MKLATFEHRSGPRLGFGFGAGIIDLRLAVELSLAARSIRRAGSIAERLVPPDMREFIGLGRAAAAAARDALAYAETAGLDGLQERGAVFALADITFMPPVTRPTNIFCVAVNGEGLAALAPKLPPYPVYFVKPTSVLTGHLRPIVLPGTGNTIPEAELAVIIGKKMVRVAAADAYDHVYGYSIMNEVTSPQVRQDDLLVSRISGTDPKTGGLVFEEVPFTAIARHKGMDTFGPMGPWLVTRDEIPDPHQLRVDGELNGRSFCKDHTSRLRFKIPQVLERISHFSTLFPGDIVTMGSASPSADWPMREVDLYREGGKVSISIEKLGTLENPIICQ